MRKNEPIVVTGLGAAVLSAEVTLSTTINILLKN